MPANQDRYRVVEAEAAVRREADHAFAEMECRAQSSAVRLQLRLQNAECKNQQMAEDMNDLRRKLARAEARNLCFEEGLDPEFAEKQASLAAKVSKLTESEAAVERLQAKCVSAEANEKSLKQLEIANLRLKKQLKEATGYKERAELLESVNMYLRDQLRQVKLEAAATRRVQRCISPKQSLTDVPSSPPAFDPVQAFDQISVAASTSQGAAAEVPPRQSSDSVEAAGGKELKRPVRSRQR